MTESDVFKKMVDEDIAHCEDVWASYSHDKDKLQELFQTLLYRYAQRIEGFTEDMWVISQFESSARMAETFRENIKKLLSRLQAFKENGYKNEGLQEYHLKKERQGMPQFNLNFSEIRIAIGMIEEISSFEKEDIMKKLGEMEEICAQPISKAKKWDMLRGYVVWVSGKEAAVAMKILPLFLNID